jgi:hypothetical protein
MVRTLGSLSPDPPGAVPCAVWGGSCQYSLGLNASGSKPVTEGCRRG